MIHWIQVVAATLPNSFPCSRFMQNHNFNWISWLVFGQRIWCSNSKCSTNTLCIFKGFFRTHSYAEQAKRRKLHEKMPETSWSAIRNAKYLVDAQASLRAQCIWTIFIDGKPCQPRGLHSILACQRNALALQPLLSSESNLCELLWNR